MTEKDERHITRMRRKKQVIDAKVGAAGTVRGLFLIHTGHGMKVVAARRRGSGEIAACRGVSLPASADFCVAIGPFVGQSGRLMRTATRRD